MKKIYAIIALSLLAFASCAGPKANSDTVEASYDASDSGEMIHGAPESN